MTDTIRAWLSNDTLVFIWLGLVLLSEIWLIRDLMKVNSHINSLMKIVWILTILYSGPIGVLLYRFSGRKQISRDTIWRKGVRSVAHCYSGCGAGEIVGVFIAVGLLSMDNTGIAVLTFTLAYLFGYGMTFGPLVQSGVPVKRALIDTFYADTLTIGVMEITAISLDLCLSANAGMSEPLFWGSLVLSLTVGLVAAYPVNVLLVYFDVKHGMADPRDVSGQHAHAH